MYSYEERKKAVEAYIKNGSNARVTVQELGYPSRIALVQWYWGLMRTGQLKEKFTRAREFSEEQRREAAEYYFDYGKSLTKTIGELALPIQRDALRNWIREFEPERELNCKRPMPLVECTQEQKEEAVALLCSQAKTGQQIAEEFGVSRPALYKWRRQLLTREGDVAMPKRERRENSGGEECGTAAGTAACVPRTGRDGETALSCADGMRCFMAVLGTMCPLLNSCAAWMTT